MRVDMDHTQCDGRRPPHCARQEEQVDISYDKQTVNRNSLSSIHVPLKDRQLCCWLPTRSEMSGLCSSANNY